jgi:hypothetical protein
MLLPNWAFRTGPIRDAIAARTTGIVREGDEH